MTSRLNAIVLVACTAIITSCSNEPVTILQPWQPVPPVTPPPPPQPSVFSRLDVFPASAEVQESEIVYLTVSARDQRSQWVSMAGIRPAWASSDSSIATVTEYGRVQAIAPGTTSISAVVTIGDSTRTGYMTVTVSPAIVSDSAVIAASNRGWLPEVVHVRAGGLVEWQTGPLNWTQVPNTILWLMDENFGEIETIDLTSGSVKRRFKNPGVVRYCSGGCWDPPDFGVIYVH